MMSIFPPDETGRPSVTPARKVLERVTGAPCDPSPWQRTRKGDRDERGTAGASEGGVRIGGVRVGRPGVGARQDLSRRSGGASERLVRGSPGGDLRAPRPERRGEV